MKDFVKKVTAIQKLKPKNEEEVNDELQGMLDRIWNRYDVHGNKELDKKEMFKFIKEVFGSTITRPKMNQIFAEVDLNDDGVIDRHEMLQFVKKLQEKK